MTKLEKKSRVSWETICLWVLLISVAVFSIIELVKDHRNADLTETSTQIAEEPEEEIPILYTWSKDDNLDRIGSYDWAEESSYDPKKGEQLSSEIFSVPFAMSETYVPNVELEELVSEDELQRYADTAKEYMMSLYNNSYRSILSDQSHFKSDIDRFWYGDSKTITMGIDSSISDTVSITEPKEESQDIETTSMENILMQWYVDNEATMECKVATDHSLIFMDNNRYYVRCEIQLTPHCKENGISQFEELFGIELENKKPTCYIVEVEMIPGDSSHINKYNVLAKAMQ